MSNGLSNFFIKPGNARSIGTLMPLNGCMNIQYRLKHCVVVVHLVLKGCTNWFMNTEFPYAPNENLWVDTFGMVVV